jgi:hypothetical protein
LEPTAGGNVSRRMTYSRAIASSCGSAPAGADSKGRKIVREREKTAT